MKKGISFLLLAIIAVGLLDSLPKTFADEDPGINFDSLASVVFKDNSGNPITNQSLDLRISLWNAFDIRSGDVDGSGNINGGALHYGGYQSTATLNPDENGLYRGSQQPGSFVLGAADFVNFPTSIGSNNAFLQLEYKLSGTDNTYYKIYDFVDDPPYDNIIRLNLMKSLSYTTADAGSKTNYNTFTLDANNNAPTDITLQFGETLAKTLSYSKTNTRFELSDSLVINGGLTATGTVNFAAANVGIGTATPQSALDVANGYYAQFEQHTTGSPAAADCQSDSQRGRLNIDIQNNRLYVCNGASRGWDYVPLTD